MEVTRGVSMDVARPGGAVRHLQDSCDDHSSEGPAEPECKDGDAASCETEELSRWRAEGLACFPRASRRDGCTHNDGFPTDAVREASPLEDCAELRKGEQAFEEARVESDILRADRAKIADGLR